MNSLENQDIYPDTKTKILIGMCMLLLIRHPLIMFSCCFHSPQHFAYRSWSSHYVQLLRVTIPHLRGLLTSVLLLSHFLRSLSQDVVVFSSRTLHLCLPREPAQQPEYFFKRRGGARFTIRLGMLTTQRSIKQRCSAMSKSTAWCDMPGEGQPTR
jgi:hypothetical protein